MTLFRKLKSNSRVILVSAEVIVEYRSDKPDLPQLFVLHDTAAAATADASRTASMELNGAWLRFADSLQGSEECKTVVLVDLPDEEFRLDSVVHRGGSDRRAQIKRKAARLFRGSPYYHTITQGREQQGRRDDQILLSALANTDPLATVINILSGTRTPVTAMTSLPLLSLQLLPKLGAAQKNLLLVTLHEQSGLRQTFFQGGQLKLSRLTKLPKFGTQPYGVFIRAEVEKMQRYLSSLRLVSREEPLNALLISGGLIQNELQRACQNNGQIRYWHLNASELASKIGAPIPRSQFYSDSVFVYLLLGRAAKNHYAPAPVLHHHRVNQTRQFLQMAGFITLVAASGWSLWQGGRTLRLNNEAAEIQKRAAYYESRYDLARGDLPQTPVSVAEVETAVAAATTLAHFKATPTTALHAIGMALEKYPNISVDKIEWLTSQSANATAGANEDNQNADNTGATPASGSAAYPFYHVAEISGELKPFDGNFRLALAQVRGLADALLQLPDVVRAEVIEQPIDTLSSASLQGDVDQSEKKPQAPFAIRMVLGVKAP